MPKKGEKGTQPPRKPRDPNKLPVREELFAYKYLACNNATEAARAAGYAEATAYAKGSELLKRPRIAKLIQDAKARIIKKYNVHAEAVVQEMAIIGFSNADHYTIDDDGMIKLTPNAPPEAIRAVKRIKRKLRLIPNGRGEDSVMVREIETEFELWNKDTQLHNLGDYLALFKENRALDPDNDELTPEERKARVIGFLRTASKRRREAGGAPATKRRSA